MALDNKTIAFPQSGMNRDKHPSSLTEQEYTFAMNANIESEDGNVNMRSSEHSTLRCIGFEGFKVIGYKNDLSTGMTYFFLTNPETKVSKVAYYTPTEDVYTLPDDQIMSAVDGTLDICENLKTLIEDSEDDPCLNFSIYHPIKTIEIKVEKCGKCIYWTDNYNPPRYVIVEKALEPDSVGIWYHYHGYRMCGERNDDGTLMTDDEFLAKYGCVLACEKLRVFPLLEQPCISPDSIAYGGSLRAGVYQFAVALCDEFGNEKTNYSQLTNPIHIFDEHDITIRDGKWGQRTNLGIRLTVTNLDRQVDYFKIAVIQNTVGYNGETQPVLDYFIEGIHPITEKTIYYYSDLNNTRTTFEHISYKKAVYNTSKGMATVDNRLLQYGLTAEKEWNLQPVVSLMGHFLKWQSSVSTGDLYKDGNACSLYVGYMRDEVYPFGISFRTKSGYTTPIFTLVPPPFKDALKKASEIPSLSTPVDSISSYIPNCYSNPREFAWQYMNTCSDGKDATSIDTGSRKWVIESSEACNNETVIRQTFTVSRIIEEHPFNDIFISVNDVNIGDIWRYISDNILNISCNGDPSLKELCEFVTAYINAEGNHEEQSKLDGIPLPQVPSECGNTRRMESVLEVPFEALENPVVETEYVAMEDMAKLDDTDIPVSFGEIESKKGYVFANDAIDQINRWRKNAWSDISVEDLTEEARDRLTASVYTAKISEALAMMAWMDQDCGGTPNGPCTKIISINGSFNYFGITPSLICSYVLDTDPWTDGGGSETGYNEGHDAAWQKIRTALMDQYVAYAEEEKVMYNNFDTQVSLVWAPDGGGGTYWSDNKESVEQYLTNLGQRNTQFRGSTKERQFLRYVSKNAIWIRVDRPESWDDPNFEGEKVVYMEAFGRGGLAQNDISSSDLVRISLWKNNTGEKLEKNIFGMDTSQDMNSGHSHIVNVTDHYMGRLTDDDFKEIGQNSFLISIESPHIRYDWWMSARWGNDRDKNYAMAGGAIVFGKTICPYVIAMRNKEVKGFLLKADTLYLRANVTFVADCVSCGDKPINCAPRLYRYGDFGYYESSHRYPANYELWDSSRVLMNEKRVYDDDLHLKAFSEIKSKMVEWYGSPSNSADGKVYYEGHIYGTVKTSTTLCQQPIRHYRFPDNFHSHFMNTDVRTTSEMSEVYPVGILIDEAIIDIFLDYAVDSGLITQEQRDGICSYELYRGDRRLNKSIVGCGLAFDFFKYKDHDGQTNIYPNYPYNDLSEDQYNYKDGGRSEYIQHPFNKDGNVWYSVLSPDFYFNKPEMAEEISIDGYMRGLSTGCFSEVKEHPKWTILSDDAYRMAKKLALAESIAQLMGEVLDLFSQSVLQPASGGLIGGIAGGVAGTVAFALGAGYKLMQRAAYVGKYFSDWVNIFINNGPRYNFAFYYSSIGQYTSMFSLQDYDTYLSNSIRGLSMCKMIHPGIIPVNDGSEDGMIYINNIFRETSMFLSLGNPEKFKSVYPSNVRDYDNSRVNDVGAYMDDSMSGPVPELTKQMSYIASPYIRLKVYKPNQYGDIEDISWLSIGGNCSMDSKPKAYFGGDTFISKFAMKRKIPFFYNNAFHIGDMIPFPYMDYRNIGYPKYFVNFDTGQKELDYIDTESFRGYNSKGMGESYFYPYKYSLYNLNVVRKEDRYVFGRFYLWFYGIPEFYVESDININFRLKGVQPHEQFYPDMADFIDWTQEKNVSIERDNDFKISPIYHSRSTIRQNVLPATYERKFYDCAYQRPNGVIWSRQDVSENSQTDPWLTYKPMDYHEFPSKNGKLIHIKRIESNQLLVRFEDQTSVNNAIDVMKERMQGNASSELGTGGLFSSRALEYNTTDLGYSGTQSTEMISSEFGHFWVDVKRAQVFMTNPNGRNLQELSIGIRHWLKKHLPFKILKYGITNVATGEPMTYEDVDNKFIGLGLSLGWDNRYKRVFITKKDYIPVKEAAYYKYDEGKFTYNGSEVSLKNTEYFEDVSFTLAYSCLKKEWISYYSFCPDYYIEQQSYFQSGLNYSSLSKEEGLWSHLLTNKSFQTFYGATYPFILEVPLKESYSGNILTSVEYELDARKYISDVDYTLDRKVGLDSIVIYNDINNSGELRLVPEEKNNLMQKVSYPKVGNNYTEILDTEVYRRHKLNDFFNRVDDDRSGVPIWVKDENDIMREVNPDALNFRKNWLDRMRGSWMLMRIKKVISDTKIIFQWIIGEDKRKNR